MDARAGIELLRQRSRPYLFSNSLPPHVVAAGIKAFEMLGSAGELRERLAENTRYFRERMTAAGFDLKKLLRLILNSRVYQLSSLPNPDNRLDTTFFTHYRVKRLTAEQLLDAINLATTTLPSPVRISASSSDS